MIDISILDVHIHTTHASVFGRPRKNTFSTFGEKI